MTRGASGDTVDTSVWHGGDQNQTLENHLQDLPRSSEWKAAEQPG